MVRHAFLTPIPLYFDAPNDAISRLVAKWEGPIQNLAKKFAHPETHEWNEYCQVGRYILMANKSRFLCPAIPDGHINICLHNAMRDFRRKANSAGSTRLKELWVSGYRPVQHVDKDPGLEQIDSEQSAPFLRRELLNWFDGLKTREKTLIGLAFYKNMTQIEAAQAMGLSRAAISQLYKRIMSKGRCALSHLADWN